ncbi:MAG: aminotransferase class III-fold pyridoxal phosphate-dependent enzyme, partial [Gemmatimonadales bacterium]
GFRVAAGGAQALSGVSPDLTTLGKVIGGGLPVGAYGGRRDLMEMVAPRGPVYQAGTLSGNPLAMAAGTAALKAARDGGVYATLGERSRALAGGLEDAARRAGVAAVACHAGGMWGFFLREAPVRSFADARQSDTDLFRRFHRAALDRGVFLPPSPFEACFVSLAHTDDVIADTLTRLGDALEQAARS